MTPLQRLRRRAKLGWIQLHAPSYWRYYQWKRGLAEPELALLPELCDATRTSVDIGGNIGLYTCALLPLSARVVVFEPLPPMARLLRRAFSRHGARFSLEQVALSDAPGEAELRMPTDAPGYATMEPSNELTGKVDTSRMARFTVPVRTLDSFGLQGVGFVKIDVEGHEAEVLRGARETFERERPCVLVEVEERHRAGSVAAVHELMAGLGYQSWYLHGGTLQPFAHFDLTRNQDLDRPEDYVRNFIFAHGAAAERLSHLSAAGQ